MPAFESAIEGFSQNGPSRTREMPFSGSGGGGSCCADADEVMISRASAAAAPGIFNSVTSRRPPGAGLPLQPSIARDFQRSHLAIEVRTLNAERLRRLADPPLMLLEDGRNVFALEAGPCLPQRAAVGEHDRPAIESHVGEHVLEA